MTTAANSINIFKPSPTISTTARFLSPIPKILTLKPLFSPSRNLQALLTTARTRSSVNRITAYTPSSVYSYPFDTDEPRLGADLLIEALEHEGVTDVFTSPGGISKEIQQALALCPSITNHICHDMSDVEYADEYARSTGRAGVCIANSGPGAENPVPNLAGARHDRVPLVIITTQVGRLMTQDLHFRTNIVANIPRLIHHAIFLATSGISGPLFVDISNATLLRTSRLPKLPTGSNLEKILCLVSESRKPILYVGKDCTNSSYELRRFAEVTGIPVASTLMGLGVYPSDGELSLQTVGMYGTYYANYAVHHSDLLLEFGAGLDDRAIGELEAFKTQAKIVQIDISPTLIGQNTQPELSICGDIKLTLQGLNELLEESGLLHKLDFSAWKEELDKQKKASTLSYKSFGDAIVPQYVIEVLDELTNGESFLCIDDKQLQMWVVQYYSYKRPLQLLSCFETPGYGIDIATDVSLDNPGSTTVCIDNNGGFRTDTEQLRQLNWNNSSLKIMVFNGEEIGPDSDFVPIANDKGVPGARVTRKQEVRAAIEKMLQTPGPYLLDIFTPHREYVLPMVPSVDKLQDFII